MLSLKRGEAKDNEEVNDLDACDRHGICICRPALFVGQLYQYHHEDEQRTVLLRSEERRVGKECRSRWSPYH